MQSGDVGDPETRSRIAQVRSEDALLLGSKLHICHQCVRASPRMDAVDSAETAK